MHTTCTPSHTHRNKLTECTPCNSHLQSYEIDYDDASESIDISFHKGRTAKGNEMSPSKMPLMRIRSVEIVFEDEMSACTDAGFLDKSIEFIPSDDSSTDDSTKCLDESEDLNADKEDSDTATLNAEADLSDDNSTSLPKDEDFHKADTQSLADGDNTQANIESDIMPIDDLTLSLNVSDIIDSGRYTQEASSSHIEAVNISAYEDALLSHTHDVINADTCEIGGDNEERLKLFEYINSDSDSSDNTAICDAESSQSNLLTSLNNTSIDDSTVCDSCDLQYDSFVDMGKF